MDRHLRNSTIKIKPAKNWGMEMKLHISVSVDMIWDIVTETNVYDS